MPITRSAFSHVVTQKGNQLRETLRLVLSEEVWKTSDDEEVSPSNNANSAIQPRYTNRRMINLSGVVKSATRAPITCAQCSRVVRGNRRERASKDYRQVLGDLSGQGRGRSSRTLLSGLNSFWESITSWGFSGKSERLIVAMKGSNVPGAKGSYFNHATVKERRAD